MPVERRCAMDGASARTHTTAPERRNRCEAGAGRQRKWFSSILPKQNGLDRQGETSISRTANAGGATRFEARRQNK
jgi:hypothetical protein